MKRKILKYIIIGVFIYSVIFGIELLILYAIEGDNIWSFIKETWDWYKTLF